MGGPPPGAMAGGGEGPSLGDLMEILLQLPPQVKKLIIEKLTASLEEGPPPEMAAGGPPGGPPGPGGSPPAGLRGAAMARAGGA